MGSDHVIDLPALNQDVQLGMLYDCRTSTFFAGLSLWDSDVVNAIEEVQEGRFQNADFHFSKSLDDARKHAGLDVEGSLSLDVGIFKASGSAEYLNDRRSGTYEARVDVSCTVARHTRRIPQETLARLKYERHLDNPVFTHFVAEVVEGGAGTLSFARTCTSSEETAGMAAKLEARLKRLPVGGEMALNRDTDDEATFEHVTILTSGIAESVANIDDALRVAREMPTKLAQQTNTLSFKLLPLSVLEGAPHRIIRKLDAGLVGKTAAALKAGAGARRKLADVRRVGVFRVGDVEAFSAIALQVEGVEAVFEAGDMEFRDAVRRLLPELRDGSSDYNEKIAELERAVALYRQRVRLVEAFADKKRRERRVLRATIDGLLEKGFENRLGDVSGLSGIGDGAVWLLLSLGGRGIERKHPLQVRISSAVLEDSDSDKVSDEADSSNSGLDSGERDGRRVGANYGDGCGYDEWFERPDFITQLEVAVTALLELKLRAGNCGVRFGFAVVEKATSARTHKGNVRVGDIVLSHRGTLSVVSSMLPAPPVPPALTVGGSTCIEAAFAWNKRESAAERVIPTTGAVVRYRSRPNASKDSVFVHVGDDEEYQEAHLAFDGARDGLTGTVQLDDLRDDCDYEVALRFETIVGPSEWSAPATTRTHKKPSAASRLISFYHDKSVELSRCEKGKTPWELTGNATPTLYLGQTVVAERVCEDAPYGDQLAVRIVDVAAEFEPQTRASDVSDTENTKVIVFVGNSGHGKSTQINAFLSFLLGGELDDAARIMVVDDREASRDRQARSITRFITCYRVRPLTPRFEGKTLLIVDTPGYGDSDGVERDKFVTAAMSVLFKTITHVNAIVYTCRANETRTTSLDPVVTYVFSLFAKDVRSCLRTIFTFSDVAKPLARAVLEELQWPVENGETGVNNAAFGIVEPDPADAPKVRDWWRLSIKGQHRVLNMLLRMPPVPTDASAQVTTDRLALERKCELVEEKILRTANEAHRLFAELGALARTLGMAPEEKVAVKVVTAVHVPVQDGKATTLCLTCSATCHEVCIYGDDSDKKSCSAMNGEHCTMCKNRCHWSKHKNARFIIRAVETTVTEMVVPEELIRRWNRSNNSLEGALLNAIDKYLELQADLRADILYLAELTDKLQRTALLHNPEGLINYVKSLIVSARLRGAPAEQLAQLTTAENTLRLAARMKDGEAGRTTQALDVLLDVLHAVRSELERRMRLGHLERAAEEERPCRLYNELRDRLPYELRKKAPVPLPEEWKLGIRRGALYPDNLRAIVELVKLVLSNGGVLAALSANGDGTSTTAV